MHTKEKPGQLDRVVLGMKRPIVPRGRRVKLLTNLKHLTL